MQVHILFSELYDKKKEDIKSNLETKMNSYLVWSDCMLYSNPS
jgi:hypothetical protein